VSFIPSPAARSTSRLEPPSGWEGPATPRVGLGYRRALHDELMAAPRDALDFVELAPENYLGLGGRWARRLEAVSAKWPVVTHGLALSLGGDDPLDASLVDGLAAFTDQVGTPWHSDHLSWARHGGHHLHELLPLPLTRETARHVAARVRDVASALPVPMAVENISAYGRYPEDTLTEADFVTEVVERADCRLLLDVNNLYVNSVNFGFDPYEALRRMPLEAVCQIHVAGFHREEVEPEGGGPRAEILVDTHGAPIADPVWPLLEAALRRTGPVPVLLERDHHIPPLAELLTEVAHIRAVFERVWGPRVAAGPQPRPGPVGLRTVEVHP